MFCPTCGAESQSTNAYCKRCGEWLPDVKTRRAAFGGKTPQQNVFIGLFMSASSVVFALISAIALYATYLGTPEEKWSVNLAATFCICIAVWQTASFMAGLRLHKRLKKGREKLSPASELDAQRTSPALSSGDKTDFVISTSVTEETTRALEPARSQRNTQG